MNLEHTIFLTLLILPPIGIIIWCAWPQKWESREQVYKPGDPLWDREKDSGVYKRENNHGGKENG